MNPWIELTHFAGFDWADDHHDLVIVDRQGAILDQWTFPHSLEGWQQCRQKIATFNGKLGVALETKRGMAVDQLLQCSCTLFPVQPIAASRLRDRKAPSGVKDDQLDAWALADGLRMDGQHWGTLAPEDPIVVELRLLTRDEVCLIEQRTLLVNQLQASLKEYYPAAIEAFENWTVPAAWDFILTFPTPELLVKAGQRKWEKFLHAHKLWRPTTAPQRMQGFAKATEWKPSLGVVAAKSRMAISLARLLKKLEEELGLYRQRIEELFNNHPDRDVFGSLPGAARKLAPRLLAEIGEDRARFESAQSLQCLAGTAPVSFKSGQISRVYIRRQCNLFLRHAVHLFANCSRRKCSWAQAYYESLRGRGKSHACALRCLGQRWLEIIWKMWQTRSHYDAEKHLANMKKHGSKVFAILEKGATQAA